MAVIDGRLGIAFPYFAFSIVINFARQVFFFSFNDVQRHRHVLIRLIIIFVYNLDTSIQWTLYIF